MTKVTVPVGMPMPGSTEVTVAVKVTGCPKTDEAGEEVTWVRVGVATMRPFAVPVVP
jgi:hypothetical protein